MKLRTPGIMLLAFASVALVPGARAQILSLSYETGPAALIGKAYQGPIIIKLADFDMGSTYIFPAGSPVGTSIGFNGVDGVGPQTIQAGIDRLDVAGTAVLAGQDSPALLGRATTTTINGVSVAGAGLEDTWGIARITSITDQFSNIVWSEAGKGQELTVMFYGLKDFYVDVNGATTTETNGVGLHVDLWLQNLPGDFNPSLGSGGRLPGVASYDTVTNGGAVKILSTVSTSGFIYADGSHGGLATEFSSIFNTATNGQGTGVSYLNVTGGTQGATFDTNAIASAFVPGKFADLQAQFTTKLNIGITQVGDWLVQSQDPVAGLFLVPVPEPSTYGITAVLALAGIVALRRRTRKSAVA